MPGVAPAFSFLDLKIDKHIDIPEGKTLADVNPEAASFYKGLGETRMDGELHNAMGDIYLNYMDIPESMVSRSEFAPLETAYRNYEANPTVANAAAVVNEAGKVQRLASSNGYNVDSPYVKVNAAMEADAAKRLGTQPDIGIDATDIGEAATDIGASVTDIGKNAADIGANAKAYVDSGSGAGDNGGGKGGSNKTGNFKDVNGLEDFKSRIPYNAVELPWRNIEGGAKEGLRYRWTDAEGNIWNVRAHSIDPSAPFGSNASNGWIYRVEVRWGGRGKKYFMDSSGNFHPYNVTNPNSPMYDEVIANDTHIILGSD